MLTTEFAKYFQRFSWQRANVGFTLIEIITVIVILSILATVGSSMIVNAMKGYRDQQQRSTLVQHARVVTEQLSRQLRTAMPNAIRVSSSGNCIEFLPVVGAFRYLNELPDSDNSAAKVTSITVVPMSINSTVPEHVIVSAFNESEVYTSADPASRVDLGTLGSSPYSSIPFISSHRFIRNSVEKRLFITEDPIRFCVSGTFLYKYYDYGFLTTAISDSVPAGNSALMANTVSTSSVAFALSAGSEDRNTAININLTFTQGSESLAINHAVLVRNVP